LVHTATLSLSAGAGAQTVDVTAATELFHQGRALLEAKDYDSACPKFQESLRLDPHIGTAISLGECEEAIHRLASARAHWQQAAGLARAAGDPRLAFAEERLAAIERRVPRITLRLPADATTRVIVKCDDVVLGPASLGVPLPVEIGAHTITTTATGREPTILTVELGEGGSREVVLVVGRPISSVATSTVQPTPAEQHDRGAGEVPAATEHVALRITSYIIGGLGVAGVGLGTYFGFQAIAGESGSPGKCVGNACDATGTRVRNGAIQDGNLSTGFFVVGAVLVASGVVSWLVSRPSPSAQTTVSVAFRVAGTEVVGRF
jgi:hypothetical protein